MLPSEILGNVYSFVPMDRQLRQVSSSWLEAINTSDRILKEYLSRRYPGYRCLYGIMKAIATDRDIESLRMIVQSGDYIPVDWYRYAHTLNDPRMIELLSSRISIDTGLQNRIAILNGTQYNWWIAFQTEVEALIEPLIEEHPVKDLSNMSDTALKLFSKKWDTDSWKTSITSGSYLSTYNYRLIIHLLTILDKIHLPEDAALLSIIKDDININDMRGSMIDIYTNDREWMLKTLIQPYDNIIANRRIDLLMKVMNKWSTDREISNIILREALSNDYVEILDCYLTKDNYIPVLGSLSYIPLINRDIGTFLHRNGFYPEWLDYYVNPLLEGARVPPVSFTRKLLATAISTQNKSLFRQVYNTIKNTLSDTFKDQLATYIDQHGLASFRDII